MSIVFTGVHFIAVLTGWIEFHRILNIGFYNIEITSWQKKFKKKSWHKHFDSKWTLTQLVV